jgi:hypothetical protein
VYDKFQERQGGCQVEEIAAELESSGELLLPSYQSASCELSWRNDVRRLARIFNLAGETQGVLELKGTFT